MIDNPSLSVPVFTQASTATVDTPRTPVVTNNRINEVGTGSYIALSNIASDQQSSAATPPGSTSPSLDSTARSTPCRETNTPSSLGQMCPGAEAPEHAVLSSGALVLQDGPAHQCHNSCSCWPPNEINKLFQILRPFTRNGRVIWSKARPALKKAFPRRSVDSYIHVRARLKKAWREGVSLQRIQGNSTKARLYELEMIAKKRLRSGDGPKRKVIRERQEDEDQMLFERNNHFRTDFFVPPEGVRGTEEEL